MRIFPRRSRAVDRGPEVRGGADVREGGAVAPAGAVNGYQVLETVAALPIGTWRYVWEPEDVRHLGPMAQDWHAAFGLNRDDTRIPVVDGLGVALVCVQALHRHVTELEAEVSRLRDAVATATATATATAEAGR